jgi:hypothetical protein
MGAERKGSAHVEWSGVYTYITSMYNPRDVTLTDVRSAAELL